MCNATQRSKEGVYFFALLCVALFVLPVAVSGCGVNLGETGGGSTQASTQISSDVELPGVLVAFLDRTSEVCFDLGSIGVTASSQVVQVSLSCECFTGEVIDYHAPSGTPAAALRLVSTNSAEDSPANLRLVIGIHLTNKVIRELILDVNVVYLPLDGLPRAGSS